MSRTLFSAVPLLILFGLWCAVAEAFPPVGQNEWVVTERMRDLNGQDHLKFSTHFDTLDRFVVVGSITENLEKGQVKMYHDAGRGLLLEQILKDPEGIIHDKYGAFVRLFISFGAYHVAVSATGKKSDGAVFVYRRNDASNEWLLQQTLYPPIVGEYVTEFGRSTHYDGTQLLVSAISRYITSLRFDVGALNVKGTRYFYEADGVSPLPTDPIYVFASQEGRRNSTSLTLATTLRDGPFTSDFGASISLSGTRLAVGAPFRQEIVYGHGTDGDLFVSNGEVKLLDGAAEYNFDNVYIQSGGVLTVDRFETLRGFGGHLKLKILNTLTIEAGGLINLTAVGYEGADTSFQNIGNPQDGKGPGAGLGATSIFIGVDSCDHDGSTTVNIETTVEIQNAGTERDINSTLPFSEANGGGGSYGTTGDHGTFVQCGVSGNAGEAYGEELLETLYHGSGGGAGFPWKIGSGGSGGDGGGIIEISARLIQNYGTIEARGGNAEAGGYYSGGGGGGAGGSIYLRGQELANFGYIYAIGGIGGQRAADTGFGGDPDSKGGDGGDGRIRFDFLTTRTIGHVLPFPKNVTTFSGDVYLYEKKVDGDGNFQWTFISTLPRLDSMMFIGHSVSLDGSKLLVASDEGTNVQPIQSVYLLGISLVQNSSSPLTQTRIFNPIDSSTDRLFGFNLRMSNQTILIGAQGTSEYYGKIYVHMGRDLFNDDLELTTLKSERPTPGDGYGTIIAYQYPQILAQLPTMHDDDVTVNDRLALGEVHLWKHIRNISVANSFVTCEYDTITANTTLNCSIVTKDKYGFANGDLIDLRFFSDPAHLDFKQIGLYSFQWTPHSAGVQEIHSTYRGERLKSFFVTVTPPIIPHLTNFTCSPVSAEAGQTITCVIGTNGDAGEDNARTYFDAYVYNLADTDLVSTDTLTTKGVFRTPKSNFITLSPHEWDFVTMKPEVTFIRHGLYQFQYTPNRPGSWAAFVNYQQEALQFPNPSIVDALDNGVHPSYSELICPPIAAPNRTLYCTVQLRGRNKLPSDKIVASNFTHSAHAFLYNEEKNAGHSIGNYTTIPVWANEGRVALLIQPLDEGTLYVHAPIGMDTVQGSPAKVDVRYLYQQQCKPSSRIGNSWRIMRQHTQGRADDIHYGEVATRAAILEDKGLCDDPRV